jgi:hypothetical protein
MEIVAIVINIIAKLLIIEGYEVYCLSLKNLNLIIDIYAQCEDKIMQEQISDLIIKFFYLFRDQTKKIQEFFNSVYSR